MPPPKRNPPVDTKGNPVRFTDMPTTRVILGPTTITPVVPPPRPTGQALVDQILGPQQKRKRRP